MKPVKYTPTDTTDYPYFTYDYPIDSLQMGHWIVFRHVTPDGTSNPQLGLFVGYSTWDMALVVHYVRDRSQWNTGENDPTLEHIALWSDNLLMIGHWSHKPSFSELKHALRSQRGYYNPTLYSTSSESFDATQ
jgi:hypothetical protein